MNEKEYEQSKFKQEICFSLLFLLWKTAQISLFKRFVVYVMNVTSPPFKHSPGICVWDFCLSLFSLFQSKIADPFTIGYLSYQQIHILVNNVVDQFMLCYWFWALIDFSFLLKIDFQFLAFHRIPVNGFLIDWIRIKCFSPRR